MKKLFLVFAVLSLFSCEPYATLDPYEHEDPQGEVHIWVDDDGNRHRTYKSDKISSHMINGVLIEYIKLSKDSVGIDSLIEAD